jgi:hypothetical protein
MMQESLRRLLGCHGTLPDGKLRFPKTDDIARSSFSGEIERIYRALGGVLPSIPPIT